MSVAPDVNSLHAAGKLPSNPLIGAIPFVKPGELIELSAPPAMPFDDDASLDSYDELPEVLASTEETAKERATIVDNRTALKNAVEHARERTKRGQLLAGISCGYSQIDKALDGLQAGCLYGCGGRAGMGKSVFGLNIAVNVAKGGHGVYYVSLEMPTMDHSLRQLFCLSGVPAYRWKNNTMLGDHWKSIATAMGPAAEYPILWDDAVGQTIEQVWKRVENAKARFAETEKILGLVIIDHAMLIRGSVRGDRRAQMVHITNSLKNMSKECNVATLALGQLSRALESRAVKDKRPQMSDFKESGSWEEDADAMLLLYRKDYYEKNRSNWNNVLEVSMPKVRGGEPGYCKLCFQGECQRVLEFEHEPPPDDEDEIPAQKPWTPGQKRARR